MTNALGAYIQHRYLNPSQPQMQWWEGMPMRAACTPQLQYNYPYPVLNAYCPSPFPGSTNIGGGASGLGFFPGLGPLSIIGGSFSETFDWVKGIIWLAGGAMGGYVVGYLWRELRTAGPAHVANRRRRARRRNTGAFSTMPLNRVVEGDYVILPYAPDTAGFVRVTGVRRTKYNGKILVVIDYPGSAFSGKPTQLVRVRDRQWHLKKDL